MHAEVLAQLCFVERGWHVGCGLGFVQAEPLGGAQAGRVLPPDAVRALGLVFGWAAGGLALPACVSYGEDGWRIFPYVGNQQPCMCTGQSL